MSDLTEMLGADVLTLGMAADEARRTATGQNVVTYLRVQWVTADDLTRGAAVIERAAEVRLQVLPADFETVLAQVRALKAAAGTRRVAAFSMADLMARGWASARELRALAEAGLDDVAELPVDQIEDLPAALGTLVNAGLRPERVTTLHPPGSRKLETIERVREAVGACPSVKRYSPLPRVAPIDKPTTGYDDVRMVALARLALGALSIEVDWALYGPKLAQVALTFGADHLDNVAAEDDLTLGPRRATVEDVERNIRAAGFEPREYRPRA